MLSQTRIQIKDRLTDASVYPVTIQSAVMDASLKDNLTTYITEYNISEHLTNDSSGTRQGTNTFTLAEAISQVPAEYRHGALKLTFYNDEGNVETRVLDSSVWDDAESSWVPMSSSVTVSPNITNSILAATINDSSIYAPYWRVYTGGTSGNGVTTYYLQYSLDGNNFATFSTFTVTNTTYSTFTNAAAGLVPAASGQGDSSKFLRGDGTWQSVSGGGVSLDFAAGTVTADTTQCLMTVAMDSSSRTYAFGEVTSSWAAPSSGTTRTVGMLLVLANNYENYVLVHNADTANALALTISSIVDSNNTNITNIIMPSSISDISAGGYVEFSIVIKEINATKYAVVTFSQEINQ